MVKARECSISVQFALALTSLDPTLARHFSCVECGQRIEPHKEGKDPAHFEHVTFNLACSLSHKHRAWARATARASAQSREMTTAL
jgi:hypothetical protein